MIDFFSNQPTELPILDTLTHLLILASLPILAWLSSRYYKTVAYRLFFKTLQFVQLLAIYGWYALAVGFPLDESLPLYHCRLAMFVVLFWPKPSKLKDYFAFLGLGGSIAAFVYPVFDPYPFWHVTIFSFIFGHLALWGNSWIYLFTTDRRRALDVKSIIRYTLIFNAFLLVVNQLTGGNYGFLAQPPLLNSTILWLNYGVVSLMLVLLICLMQCLYDWVWQHKV